MKSLDSRIVIGVPFLGIGVANAICLQSIFKYTTRVFAPYLTMQISWFWMLA